MDKHSSHLYNSWLAKAKTYELEVFIAMSGVGISGAGTGPGTSPERQIADPSIDPRRHPDFDLPEKKRHWTFSLGGKNESADHICYTTTL